MTRLFHARITTGSVSGAWWLAWRKRHRGELLDGEASALALGDMLAFVARLRRRMQPHRCPECHMPHGGVGQ